MKDMKAKNTPDVIVMLLIIIFNRELAKFSEKGKSLSWDKRYLLTPTSKMAEDELSSGGKTVK